MSEKFNFFLEDDEKPSDFKKLTRQLQEEFKQKQREEKKEKDEIKAKALKRFGFRKKGIQKYQVRLEGEMQVNSMNVKTVVENKYILQLKEIYENSVLIDLVSYDKEMVETSNPTFKEMFMVTRQLEKLYDEFTARVSHEGEILEIKNLSALQEKWLRIKKELVPYFNEGTNIEEFFSLNDQTMKSPDIWKQLLNEQEFLFLFFKLAGYGKKLNFSDTLVKENAYRSGKIAWDIQGYTPIEFFSEVLNLSISGSFKPSTGWLDKAYGKMPFMNEISFQPSYQLQADYQIDSESGFIRKAHVYWEEIAHPSLVFHKMKFTITQIS